MIEHHFIYFPLRELESDPSDLGLPFDEVYFVTQDGVRLHGWFVPGEKDLVWLWCHGNAGNISHRLENLALLHQELGISIFLFDYRGYGRSEGRPSEKGTYLDAEATLAYLHSRGDVNKDRIIYFGRSLGAAVAVEMATRQAPAALILESPFPSVSYMARRLYPFLPVWPLLRTRYDSLSKIGEVQAPRSCFTEAVTTSFLSRPAGSSLRQPVNLRSSTSYLVLGTTTPTWWADRTTSMRCAALSRD